MERTNHHRLSLVLAFVVAVLVVSFGYLRWNSRSSKQGSARSEASASSGQEPSGANRIPLDATDLATDRGHEPGRAPESDRRPEAGTLVVQVTNEVDQPVAAAHVLLFDAKALLGNATSDADGTCSFPAAEGEGGALAWIEGHAPVRQATTLSAGKTTIRFADRARVSGSARLTDGSPTRKVGLLLQADRPFFRVDDLPSAVREALPDDMRSGTHIEGATDEEGRFAFAGLDSAWKGLLCVFRSHWLVESSQGSLRHEGALWPYESSVALDAPVVGLSLTILELPAFTGRIVSSDGKTPVPRAHLGWIIRVLDIDGAAGPPMGGCRIDERGCFRIAVDPINSLTTSAWIVWSPA